MVDPSQNPNPVVIVKPLAYMKMLKHVLRWGNMAKRKSQMKECMGMLFGKLGAQKGTVHDVIVMDVVEVTHGGHIEVAFEDKDYVAFAEINEKYAEQGIFNIGWYHSHPGLSVFLSTVDVRNHLGFQTTNPSAIAIVWDHVLLEEENHIGFETFRLTELGKGQYSDYTTVETYVEPPDDKEYYKFVIKETLDMLLAGNPPMFELNELPNIIGDYEPTPIEDEKFKPPEISPDDIVGTPAKINSGEISTQLADAMNLILNQWGKDLSQQLKNKGVVVNQNLTALKDVIESKVKDLQKWFMNKAYDVFMDVWEKSDTAIENRINTFTGLIELINQKYPQIEIEDLPEDIATDVEQNTKGYGGEELEPKVIEMAKDVRRTIEFFNGILKEKNNTERK